MVVVFIVYNRTSIIMASGRELSYVLLSGILASYAMTFVILGAPSIVNCTRKRSGRELNLIEEQTYSTYSINLAPK